MMGKAPPKPKGPPKPVHLYGSGKVTDKVNGIDDDDEVGVEGVLATNKTDYNMKVDVKDNKEGFLF